MKVCLLPTTAVAQCSCSLTLPKGIGIPEYMSKAETCISVDAFVASYEGYTFPTSTIVGFRVRAVRHIGKPVFPL